MLVAMSVKVASERKTSCTASDLARYEYRKYDGQKVERAADCKLVLETNRGPTDTVQQKSAKCSRRSTIEHHRNSWGDALSTERC